MMRLHKKFPDLKKVPMLALRSGKYRYSGRGAEQAAVSKYVQAASSAGLCFFSLITGDMRFDERLSAATGWEVAPADYMTVGHRVLTLRQRYNVREGIKPSAVSISDRVLGNPPQEKGPLAGVTIDLEAMRGDYYGALGWDAETGVPTQGCLELLGMANL
jgi:aldehyde:ferredoxin oxidoreductase